MLFISSFSILLSFFGDYNGSVLNVIMAYAVGILFWVFMLAAYILLIILNSKRKKSRNTAGNNPRKDGKRHLPGAFRFFSNKYAAVADISMILFLILTVVFAFIPVLNQLLEIIFISFFIFSLHMHCILNGVNFTYTLNSKGDKKNVKI